jgi:predicted ATPase
MHLASFSVKNLRSIETLEWRLVLTAPQTDANWRAGWHVVLGDNGAGKSTLLRAVAFALIGAKDADALREDWSSWVSEDAATAEVVVSAAPHPDDEWRGSGRKVTNYHPTSGIRISRNKDELRISPMKFRPSADRTLWSDKPGWFAASFGPFRRFRGGDKDSEKLFYSHPRLARHLSVFGEDVALTECLDWLRQLRFEQLDGNKHSGQVLEQLKRFINQDGFLPHGVKFEAVTANEVQFTDGQGRRVPVTALSDGFRSILSLCFEVLRQMNLTWNGSTLFEDVGDSSNSDFAIQVKHSGVVLVDEIDAHLHPTWQRQIGFWLTKHFPKVQFIVTTHSPLICHAAERGSIFRLPTPGTEEKPRMITGIERERLIFGSVLDAYGTELFGVDVSRSASSKKKQLRLAELNQKGIAAPLSKSEVTERDGLQALFPAAM